MPTDVDRPRAIRPGEEVDGDALLAYLRTVRPELTGPLEIRQFPSGYSNLTYAVSSGTQEFVLRRPPFGAAVKSAHTSNQASTALMGRIAETAGIAATVTGDALVAALRTAIAKPAATGDAAEIAGLKGQVAALQSQLTGYVQVTAQERAVTAIDKAITDGKVPPAMRDHYIARHVRDAAEVDKEISLLPSIHSGGLSGRQPPKPAGAIGQEADADEQAVLAQMGVDPAAYAETRKTLYKAEG